MQKFNCYYCSNVLLIKIKKNIYLLVHDDENFVDVIKLRSEAMDHFS